jgi:hypothetical protein
MRVLKPEDRISVVFGATALFITMALVFLASTEVHRIKANALRITSDTMPSIYLSGQLQSVTLFRYLLLTDYAVRKNDAEKAALNRQIESANTQSTISWASTKV